MEDYKKPRWWKRSFRSYFLVFILVPFCAMLIVDALLVHYGLREVVDVLTGIVITIIAIAGAYYIRTIPSPRLWKAVWIVIGVGMFGFPILVSLLFLVANPLIPVIGGVPSILSCAVISALAGAWLGNQVGKRRDYRPFG